MSNINRKINERVSRTNALIGITGIVFLVKKNSTKNKKKYSLPAFWKGAFLNLISIQVLLFWIIAVTFLHNHHKFYFSPLFIMLFLAGIWVGKMGALWLYARASHLMISKSSIFTENINKIIGSILLVTATFQIFNIP